MPDELGGRHGSERPEHGESPLDRRELLRTFRPSDRHYTPTDQLTDEEIIAQFKEEQRRLGLSREDAPLHEDDPGETSHGQVDEAERVDRSIEWRGVPVEGPDNTPLDLSKPRPIREWREGDPPVDPGNFKHRDEIIYVRPERRDDKDPDSGLGRPEAAPDPSLTPEQGQTKFAEQYGRAAEVLGVERWSNSKYAGLRQDIPRNSGTLPARRAVLGRGISHVRPVCCENSGV